MSQSFDTLIRYRLITLQGGIFMWKRLSHY